MVGLFLPFAARAKAVEQRAIEVKRRYGYGPYDAIDPEQLAQRMGVLLVPDAWIGTLDVDIQRALLVDNASSWSAATLTVENVHHVLMNPTHSPTRRSPSLAEELVHIALGHPPSQVSIVDGVATRTCRTDTESEAYAVAVALLLPYRTVFNHVDAGQPLDALPTLVPLSPDCRYYRVKITGLWRTYQARLRGASTARAASRSRLR